MLQTMSQRYSEMRSTSAQFQGLLEQRGEESIKNWEAQGDERTGKSF